MALKGYRQTQTFKVSVFLAWGKSTGLVIMKTSSNNQNAVQIINNKRFCTGSFGLGRHQLWGAPDIIGDQLTRFWWHKMRIQWRQMFVRSHLQRMCCNSKQWYAVIWSHSSSPSSVSDNEFWIPASVPLVGPYKHSGLVRCRAIATRRTCPQLAARATMLTITSAVGMLVTLLTL